jgi:hypothetical protein
LFTEGATRLIYENTGGTPRLINILCDTALMYGFATESSEITEDLVQVVLHDKQRYGVFPRGTDILSGDEPSGEVYSWRAQRSQGG